MKLTDVKDSAPEFGLGDIQEARFAKGELDAEKTGVSYFDVQPNQRSPFGHKHDQAEEVYVIIAGSGRMKLDDEIIEVSELDVIRVAPEVVRAFESGPNGIRVLAMGARHDGDGEIIQGWWTD
jgi:mannose-6-phosphate isomerase-like protein (cupin superfamily)